MTYEDWKVLNRLSEETGISPQRVGFVRSRFEPKESTGDLTALLLGRAETRFEEFFASAFRGSREATPGGPRMLKLGGGQQDLAIWSVSSDVEGTLADQIGGVDLLVLVTRLNHPLTQREWELARRLSTIASVIRIAYVMLPGEEISSSELAELRKLTKIKLRQAGYQDGRALDAELWESSRACEGLVSLLDLEGVDLQRLREATSRRNLESLILDGLSHAEQMGTVPIIAPETAATWVRQFSGYLENLFEEVFRTTCQDRLSTCDAVVLTASQLLLSLPDRDLRVNHWREAVEKVWPQAWEQIGEWAALIWKDQLTISWSLDPVAAPPAFNALHPLTAQSLPIFAKQIAAGLAGGIIAALLISLTPVGGNSIVVTMAALLGLISGTFAGMRFTKKDAKTPELPPVQRTVIGGWEAASAQISARLRRRLERDKTGLIREWKNFISRANLD